MKARFDSVKPEELEWTEQLGGTPFALSLVGADHLLVTALDHTWRAVFTRRR
jgi:hypothetical protein